MRISNDGLRLSAWTRQEDHSAESLSENASPCMVHFSQIPIVEALVNKNHYRGETESRGDNYRGETESRRRRRGGAAFPRKACVPAALYRRARRGPGDGCPETRPLSYKQTRTAWTKADLNSADQEQSSGVWHAMVSVKTPHGGTLLDMGGTSRSRVRTAP